jgi:N-acylneuraminate cytidylyltransferase
MWVLRRNRLLPLLPLSPPQRPWHSSQYQDLPEVYVQNASLEIAWSRVARETGTIAGTVVVPLLTEGQEGFDINDESDWLYAEHLVETRQACLPEIPVEPFLKGKSDR